MRQTGWYWDRKAIYPLSEGPKEVGYIAAVTSFLWEQKVHRVWISSCQSCVPVLEILAPLVLKFHLFYVRDGLPTVVRHDSFHQVAGQVSVKYVLFPSSQ